MIASNNPIEFEPFINIVRIPTNVDVNNTFPVLANSVGVDNASTALIGLSLSTSRVFATFSVVVPTGTVSVTTGSDIVTGDNTDFTNEIVPGDVITIEGEQVTVVEIINSTTLRVDVPIVQATASNIIFVKSARPTQRISLTVLISNAPILGANPTVEFIETIALDVSINLTGQLSVDWPDDGGGTCRFALVDQNPFTSSDPITIDQLVVVKATFTDSLDNTFTVKIFKGRIVQVDYNPDTNLTDIDVQDLSREVSHETDKIDQEIQNVDPVFTETVTAPANDRLVVSKNLDTSVDEPIFGIWNESDTERDDNLAEEFDFTIGTNRKTIDIFQSGKIFGGRNYLIRYAIPRSSFTRITRKKSEIIQDIAKLAGITSLINERTGEIEDEVVDVNIVSNQEFPLDLMRKIVLPQTWKIEYTEGGDLLVRREQLKATPDLTFNESSIIVDTLTISKSIDTVINEQRIAGVLKRLGELIQDEDDGTIPLNDDVTEVPFIDIPFRGNHILLF